jgi:hypothetical protein
MKTLALAAVAVASFALPAAAHHSFAMFDATKTVELKGTVKEFLMVNPHSWINVMVTDAKGQSKEWAIEMRAPAGLMRSGWTAKTVVPGDKVTIVAHPLKDGTEGGQFLHVILPDGKKLTER